MNRAWPGLRLEAFVSRRPLARARNPLGCPSTNLLEARGRLRGTKGLRMTKSRVLFLFVAGFDTFFLHFSSFVPDV